MIIFVAEEKEETFKRLEIMFENLDVKMTKDKYFDMCEQLGNEPEAARIPPGIEDFPLIVQAAIDTFNMLGDRIYPEIGYMGKDYTNLNYYVELYDIKDAEFFLQVLAWLDSRAIKKSSEQIKKQLEKLKRNSSGK